MCSLGHAGVEDILDLFGFMEVIPQPFRDAMPNSHKAMMTALKDLFQISTPPEIRYDLCPACLHVFRRGTREDEHCPRCGTNRYSPGKRKAALQVRYVGTCSVSVVDDDHNSQELSVQLTYKPIRETITQWFGCPALAKEAAYHATNRSREGDVLDFQDGECYRQLHAADPKFATEARNLMLGIVSDGVQPFEGNDSYSMWPVVITCYNSPPPPSLPSWSDSSGDGHTRAPPETAKDITGEALPPVMLADNC